MLCEMQLHEHTMVNKKCNNGDEEEFLNHKVRGLKIKNVIKVDLHKYSKPQCNK